MPATEEVQAIEELMESQELILAQLKKVIVGQEEVINQMLMALFAGGTLLVRRGTRTRQNPHNSDFGTNSELKIQANPVHPGPDACRHHRHRCA